MNENKTLDVRVPQSDAVSMGAASPVSVTPMQLIEVALNQNADLEKLEKLWELQQKWEAKEAHKAFNSAMALFSEKCPVIVKNKTVDYTSAKGRTTYKHADLAGMVSQIQPILSECRLSHSWRTEQTDGCMMVTCIITHTQGHSESTSMVGQYDSSGGKNTIQSIGSTTTYLQRYTLSSILGLAAGEDDDGAGSVGVELDVEAIKQLFESAKSVIELDERAKLALHLSGDDKEVAKGVYMLRKKELNGE